MLIAESEKYVLVTGGAGFIGSHTVVNLLEEGRKVVIIDNLSNSAAGQDGIPLSVARIRDIVTKEQNDVLHFRKGNYGNLDFLEDIFNEFSIECVIHFGGFKAVAQSKKRPWAYYWNNVAETLSLIKALTEHNVKSLIFSSSATTYTELPPDKLPFAEDSPQGNCTCPYANTKLFIETIFRDIVHADPEWKVLALRYFNPVGAHKSGVLGEDPLGTPNNLMPYIASVAVGRRPHLNVFGSDYSTVDGSPVRDYVHVLDTARGHTAALKVLAKMATGFRAYNLGSGKGTSVLQMVEAYKKATGADIPYKMTDRRPGDHAVCFCDPDRARRELGWETKHSIEEMCRDSFRFQQKNPRGYNDS